MPRRKVLVFLLSQNIEDTVILLLYTQKRKCTNSLVVGKLRIHSPSLLFQLGNPHTQRRHFAPQKKKYSCLVLHVEPFQLFPDLLWNLGKTNEGKVTKRRHHSYSGWCWEKKPDEVPGTKKEMREEGKEVAN